MGNSILSWRRVRALCVKETRQIVRDPSSWLIAVVIPLLLLFIFGYGINLDSSRLRVGVLLEQQSEEALDFVHTMTGSPYIDATVSDSRRQLIEMMQAGRIRAMVVIPVDFDRQMARPGADAPLQLITDGSEPNTANFAQGYVEGIWQIWQQQRAEDRGETFEPLIDVQMRYWFNPAAISQHFIIPGAITIIMTMTTRSAAVATTITTTIMTPTRYSQAGVLRQTVPSQRRNSSPCYRNSHIPRSTARFSAQRECCRMRTEHGTTSILYRKRPRSAQALRSTQEKCA